MIQTIILSFTPIFILLVQNGTAFYSVMQEKELIIHKADLVRYIRGYMMIEHYYANITMRNQTHVWAESLW